MALALLHNRDQVLWRHAHMYWSQDMATQMFFCNTAALNWRKFEGYWLVCNFGRTQETAGMHWEFLYFRCGKYSCSFLSGNHFSHPDKDFLTRVYVQEHADNLHYCVFQWCCGKKLAGQSSFFEQRILLNEGCKKKEKSSHTYMTKYFIRLASSPKKSTYFITRSCFVCRIDQNQSSNWRINLISLQICKPFLLLFTMFLKVAWIRFK